MCFYVFNGEILGIRSSATRMIIDFKQIFDRVCRTKLWTAMQVLDYPKKQVNLIRMSLEKAQCKIRIELQYAESFEVNNDLRGIAE